MAVKGSDLLAGLDKILAEEYGISNLTEKEQVLFFLGMRMGNVATEHIICRNIVCSGAITSYNYIKQCLPIYKKNECFEGKYYWQKLQEIAKQGAE